MPSSSYRGRSPVQPKRARSSSPPPEQRRRQKAVIVERQAADAVSSQRTARRDRRASPGAQAARSWAIAGRRPLPSAVEHRRPPGRWCRHCPAPMELIITGCRCCSRQWYRGRSRAAPASTASNPPREVLLASVGGRPGSQEQGYTARVCYFRSTAPTFLSAAVPDSLDVFSPPKGWRRTHRWRFAADRSHHRRLTGRRTFDPEVQPRRFSPAGLLDAARCLEAHPVIVPRSRSPCSTRLPAKTFARPPGG